MCDRVRFSVDERVGGLLRRERDETRAAVHAPVVRARRHTQTRPVLRSVAPHVHELRTLGPGHADRLHVRPQGTGEWAGRPFSIFRGTSARCSDDATSVFFYRESRSKRQPLSFGMMLSTVRGLFKRNRY